MKGLRLYSLASLLLMLFLIVLLTTITHAQVTVVNMIPNAQSGEIQQDSEPNLAVNPANPLQIVGSAFTPNPSGGSNAPIYVSVDGGNTWVVNSIVPGNSTFSGTGDITVRFGSNSNILYAGTLRGGFSFRLNILRTANITGSTPMTVLVDRYTVDQPYIQAATVMGGAGVTRDRVYVGHNEYGLRKNAGGTGRTSTIEQSFNAGITTPTFNPARIESRNTGTGVAGQDGPPTRPAIHPDGRIYGIFYGWRGGNLSSGLTSDVVVVRDNNWGLGASPFTALTDPGDGNAGMRVVQGRTIPWASGNGLGQERFVGSNLSIAVDPRNSATVYIAWADRVGTNYTLHVRRSLTWGVNWSTSDLLTITNATNPALAINIRGKIGFLYQALTGTGSSQRWVTHLRRSTNGTTWDDTILANVPGNTPTRVFGPYIGDYVHLMAVGKDFYGIFSANNTPNNANFPQGVTYQRNANFTTNTLLALDNTTTVNISIDPFFFRVTELAEESDFYIRDWTDSPTSRDTGLEPSTKPAFYTTSDVWNRRSNAPAAFNANDQPQSQDPQISTLGNNFAFARVHRKATGTAKTVTLHFLKSEFGTGSSYQNANTTPDPTLTFAATEAVKTMTSGYQWTLTATTSSHTCIAVEISTTNDPIVTPSLLGRAPGWPTTDLMVINDNNKAQRNMGVYSTGGTGSASDYAIAHNAATYPRDMEIRYEVAPEVLEKLHKPRIEIIGDSDNSYIFGNTITLANMQPGENRWIGLTIPVPSDTRGELLPVEFYEIVDNMVINGFAIAAQPSTLEKVLRKNLEFHGEVFIRMAAAFNIDRAKEEGQSALLLLLREKVSENEYIQFLQVHINTIQALFSKLLSLQGSNDPFHAQIELENLKGFVELGDANRAVPVHATFLHKLDAFLTMLQKLQGDPADILQNVRWQKDLYSKIPQLKELEFTGNLLEMSQQFILDYQSRKIDNNDYLVFIRRMLQIFRNTATELKDKNLQLEQDIFNMERNLDSPTALQKAHRGYLLKLQSLEK
ncbi:MAG: hypothetical protein ACE5JB_13005 [bacterium]